MDQNELNMFVQSLKDRVSALPWYIKLACFVLLPVGVFMFFTAQGRKLILDFLENKARSKADQALDRLSKIEAETKAQTLKEEGNLARLEQEKKEAQDKAAKDSIQEDIDFFNNRNKDK